IIGKQLLDGNKRLRRVITRGIQSDGRPPGCGQHHHTHDALGIDALPFPGNVDFARKLAGQLSELCRCTRMQPQFVGDDDVDRLQRKPRIPPCLTLAARESSSWSGSVRLLSTIFRLAPERTCTAFPACLALSAARQAILNGVAPYRSHNTSKPSAGCRIKASAS